MDGRPAGLSTPLQQASSRACGHWTGTPDCPAARRVSSAHLERAQRQPACQWGQPAAEPPLPVGVSGPTRSRWAPQRAASAPPRSDLPLRSAARVGPMRSARGAATAANGRVAMHHSTLMTPKTRCTIPCIFSLSLPIARFLFARSLARSSHPTLAPSVAREGGQGGMDEWMGGWRVDGWTELRLLLQHIRHRVSIAQLLEQAHAY